MRGSSPSHGLAAPPAAYIRARGSALSPCGALGAARTKRGTCRARQVAACCSALPTLPAVEPSESQRYLSFMRSSSSLVSMVTVISSMLAVILAAVFVLIPEARISLKALEVIGTVLLAVIPPVVAQFFAAAAGLEQRDKAAAEQRKADVAAAAEQREAAAEQRMADVAAQEARDRAAAARDESLKSIITSYKMSTNHRIESVAAGLNNLRTTPNTAPPPAVTWSAAEVSESSPAHRKKMLNVEGEPLHRSSETEQMRMRI